MHSHYEILRALDIQSRRLRSMCTPSLHNRSFMLERLGCVRQGVSAVTRRVQDFPALLPDWSTLSGFRVLLWNQFTLQQSSSCKRTGSLTHVYGHHKKKKLVCFRIWPQCKWLLWKRNSLVQKVLHSTRFERSLAVRKAYYKLLFACSNTCKSIISGSGSWALQWSSLANTVQMG